MRRHTPARPHWSYPFFSWFDHAEWCRIWLGLHAPGVVRSQSWAYALRWRLRLIGLVLRQSLRLGLLRGLAWLLALALPSPAAPAAGAARVLVLAPAQLGDLILLTPALRRLRQRYSQADITLAVGRTSFGFTHLIASVDRRLVLPFPGFDRDWTPGRPLRAALILLRAAWLVRSLRFQQAFLLVDDLPWAALLAALAGIPRRVGLDSPLCAPFLTERVAWQPGIHYSAEMLTVVEAGAPGSMPLPALLNNDLDYRPAPADHGWANDWLQQQGIDAGCRLIIVHPGTGGQAKQWPAQSWAMAINALAALPAVRVVLTGTPAEAGLIAQISSQLARPALTLVGQTSVGQLAALMARAALVLGVDNGPLHLAVSQATPSLALFGPTEAARFGPWSLRRRHQVIQSRLWCSPCNKIDSCPRGINPAPCMRQIAVVEVVGSAQSLLEQAEKLPAEQMTNRTLRLQ